MAYDTESDYLDHYNIHDYELPLVSVDLAIFSLQNQKLQVLLVERGDHPHKGRWALPGGFVDTRQDKDLQDTALRKLREKAGVRTPYVEQVASAGNAGRDPRGWSITILFMALIPFTPAIGGDAVRSARWWPYAEALDVITAFDHRELLQQARARLRSKTAYTLLPMHVLEPPFTLTRLQEAFEELLEDTLEKKAFRRRILNADVLEEVGEDLPEGGRGRPAILYRPRKGSEQHVFSRQVLADRL